MNKILPIIWSDNYISLLPDEKKEIEATYNFKNKNPKLNVIGWNLKKLLRLKTKAVAA